MDNPISTGHFSIKKIRHFFTFLLAAIPIAVIFGYFYFHLVFGIFLIFLLFMVHPETPVPLLARPWVLLGGTGFVAALFFPCFSLALLISHFYPPLPYNRFWPVLHKLWTEWFILISASAAVLWAIVRSIREVSWILQEIRQVDNLPGSKARSVTPGLAEMSGTARSLDAEGSGIHPLLRLIEADRLSRTRVAGVPFYLEDETGRILVDPGKAQPGSAWAFILGFRCHDIILTRHRIAGSWFSPSIRELRPGDPVYIVGSVQLREDSPQDARGPEALVIRPLVEERQDFFWKIFHRYLSDEHPFSHRFQHVFFLSDTVEITARKLLIRHLVASLIIALVWIVPALWVLINHWIRYPGL